MLRQQSGHPRNGFPFSLALNFPATIAMSIPASHGIRAIYLIPFTMFLLGILQVISPNSVHFSQVRKVPRCGLRRAGEQAVQAVPVLGDPSPRSGTDLTPKRCKPPKSVIKFIFLTTLLIKLLVFNCLRDHLPKLTASESGTYPKTA
jgi:hypothetical protein